MATAASRDSSDPARLSALEYPTDDVEEQVALSMEEYWKGLEDTPEVVDEKKVKEKKDLSDVLQRIRETTAVKAREAHRLDQEFIDDQ